MLSAKFFFHFEGGVLIFFLATQRLDKKQKKHKNKLWQQTATRFFFFCCRSCNNNKRKKTVFFFFCWLEGGGVLTELGWYIHCIFHQQFNETSLKSILWKDKTEKETMENLKKSYLNFFRYANLSRMGFALFFCWDFNCWMCSIFCWCFKFCKCCFSPWISHYISLSWFIYFLCHG